MKKKDLIEIRNKNIPELKKEVQSRKKELTLLWARIKAGKEKKFAKVRLLKQETAQLLTIISEKEILERETK